MIITRTPFRISFAGGGSDLEAFWKEEPGAVLSTAIDKYVYLTVQPRFGDSFRVSYSRTEITRLVEEIEHPIVRESLKLIGAKRGLEIVSVADLPAQSGMGSSSSFTVGLLHALYAEMGRAVSADSLAEAACKIEIEVLNEPIGKQDQYIAAHGGLQFIEFQPSGVVHVDPVICPLETVRKLDARLMLFFTGRLRAAREVLARQRVGTTMKREALRNLCGIARRMRDVLQEGRDLDEFGQLLHTAWEYKKSVESTISDSEIDHYYRRGLAAGAVGGKLLGAGGGGFLLFYCDPERQADLRAKLSDLVEVPFQFEPQGSKVIFVSRK
jgi:D-glycero-alpha-D-manno-heptose-7-phosphate kinase